MIYTKNGISNAWCWSFCKTINYEKQVHYETWRAINASIIFDVDIDQNKMKIQQIFCKKVFHWKKITRNGIGNSNRRQPFSGWMSEFEPFSNQPQHDFIQVREWCCAMFKRIPHKPEFTLYQLSYELLFVVECFTTTFLHTHSWLNWIDDDDDWRWWGWL